MTEQRRVVARVMSESGDHPDFVELYRRISLVDGSISVPTVYRTLRLFEDAGIIESHNFQGGRARYEPVSEGHHDHLIDINTGEVIEVADPDIERRQEMLAEKYGYELVGHRLELYGIAKQPKDGARAGKADADR